MPLTEHFYVALGLIPAGLFIFFMNAFVGPAELSEIPEDYTPENYEYFQNPVKRFMCKHFYPDPVHRYEANLHYLKQSDENQKFKLLERKVKELMSERGDYKGWYYVPVDPTAAYLGKEQRETEEAIVLDR
ncbi:DgyrCDS5174 [Dimorphilus gyrociliatus]|uniref:NADH dehydrogenase [ubiquinone] 1 beta subcomplex subunit 5, mitochondrial n=1 Tax=Dimorphilus gyrociliatus TaxID=2664684 RepID=A0A7I8VNV3_9ANNE|nr:DgyrCDS5174 [Dimorphilus gyrociliatus]